MWGREYNILVHDDLFFRVVGHSGDQQSLSIDISTALRNAFDISDSNLFTSSGLTIGMCCRHDIYYLFDSHARDHQGFPFPEGAAILLTFSNLNELILYISRIYHGAEFNLSPVVVGIRDINTHNLGHFIEPETHCLRDNRTCNTTPNSTPTINNTFVPEYDYEAQFENSTHKTDQITCNNNLSGNISFPQVFSRAMDIDPQLKHSYVKGDHGFEKDIPSSPKPSSNLFNKQASIDTCNTSSAEYIDIRSRNTTDPIYPHIYYIAEPIYNDTYNKQSHEHAQIFTSTMYNEDVGIISDHTYCKSVSYTENTNELKDFGNSCEKDQTTSIQSNYNENNNELVSECESVCPNVTSQPYIQVPQSAIENFLLHFCDQELVINSSQNLQKGMSTTSMTSENITEHVNTCNEYLNASYAYKCISHNHTYSARRICIEKPSTVTVKHDQYIRKKHDKV
ncbi:unnamed protein product [Mytilus edulis]|uniref:Uncharacterized protein n=1 Tax=Mytilus edulis TaxID=6550 RepID=A0A8S3UQ33_MYTED|nr:unnamed protein product [Mytilus edulis]